MKKEILAFAAALLAGVAIGSNIGPKHGAARSMAVEEKTSQPQERQPRSYDNFLKAMRERSAADSDPLAGELSGWSDVEIRAALEESLKDPDSSQLSSSASRLANLLFAEWMKRDFDSAFGWFTGLEVEAIQIRMAFVLGNRWPEERAEEGLAFLRSHRRLFSGSLSSGGRLLVIGLGAEAKKGWKPMADMLAQLQNEKIRLYPGAMGLVGRPFPLPEGFDFPSFVASEQFQKLWDGHQAYSFLNTWRDRDRDQVFDWLLSKHGTEGLDALEAPEGPRQRKDHMEWLAGKLDKLEPAERLKFVGEMTAGLVRAPDMIVEFAAGVKDPELSLKIREQAVQSIYNGETPQAMPLFDNWGDPAGRIALLMNAKQKTFVESADGTPASPFGKADEVLLRRKLAEWNATDQQIETIIGRFKP